MQCSNCGYDNPREHHYCGMCGTPFPYRALTVPQAQSTLAFTKAPLRVAAPLLAPEVREPVEPPATVAEELAPAANTDVLEPVEPAVAVAEELAPPANTDVPERVEPAEQVSLIEQFEVVAQVEVPTETPAEALGEIVEVAAPEPERAVEAASDEPVAVEPEVDEPPQPVTTEPEPAVAEAAQDPVVERPAAEVHRPAARVVVPTATYHRWPEPSEPPPAKPIVRHPSPDTQTFTPPPASAGMPTFQGVAEAAGAPPISPFEPPTERHTDEDRELQEYVASFRYTPPVETADEMTMRSEAPVIDDEAPAEFHHPSFDDDVPPPPEAGPHPTGQEYYPPEGTAERPRFLEFSDAPASADEGAYPAILGGDVPPRRVSKRWLWVTLAALIGFFGGLGFLEGRAQSTHAFRGPVEIVGDVYDRLRQQLTQLEKPAAKTQPEVAAQSNAPAGTPASSTSSAQPAPTNPESEAKTTTTAATGAATAKSEPPKAVQPPPTPKPTAKPQPGQQELDKAVNASDPTAAAAWLWKATSRGNPEAPVRLADMYIKGDGVPRSCEQAMVLLRSAATKENAPARNRLAALYANGTCVTRDRVKAYQLMSSALAVDPNSAWAKENREVLWNQMTPQERAEAQKYR